MSKQVGIVIRKDLKMRRGKEIAQGAHASIAFLTRRIRRYVEGVGALLDGPRVPRASVPLSEVEKEWILGSFMKVCVVVNSEEELLEIHEKAQEAELVCSLIQDSGRTEFHGEPTNTCLAIGPDDDAKVDEITGHLKLY